MGKWIYIVQWNFAPRDPAGGETFGYKRISIYGKNWGGSTVGFFSTVTKGMLNSKSLSIAFML